MSAPAKGFQLSLASTGTTSPYNLFRDMSDIPSEKLGLNFNLSSVGVPSEDSDGLQSAGLLSNTQPTWSMNNAGFSDQIGYAKATPPNPLADFIADFIRSPIDNIPTVPAVVFAADRQSAAFKAGQQDAARAYRRGTVKEADKMREVRTSACETGDAYSCGAALTHYQELEKNAEIQSLYRAATVGALVIIGGMTLLGLATASHQGKNE